MSTALRARRIDASFGTVVAVSSALLRLQHRFVYAIKIRLRSKDSTRDRSSCNFAIVAVVAGNDDDSTMVNVTWKKNCFTHMGIFYDVKVIQ